VVIVEAAEGLVVGLDSAGRDACGTGWGGQGGHRTATPHERLLPCDMGGTDATQGHRHQLQPAARLGRTARDNDAGNIAASRHLGEHASEFLRHSDRYGPRDVFSRR